MKTVALARSRFAIAALFFALFAASVTLLATPAFGQAAPAAKQEDNDDCKGLQNKINQKRHEIDEQDDENATNKRLREEIKELEERKKKCESAEKEHDEKDKKADDEADIVIGCAGGGSNFAGLTFPFAADKLTGKARKLRIIAVEPAACPSLTRGKYVYDFGDTVGLTPLVKMHTLGHGFVPAPLHAGGLRYHGMAPLVCKLYDESVIEAVAVPQLATFQAAMQFARTEGIIPAPESAHAIKVTIAAVERALKLIEALAGEPDGVDLSLLAERLDLPFSATHRLLATLAERGFVGQDAQSGAYGLTLKLAQLAFRDLDSRGLPGAPITGITLRDCSFDGVRDASVQRHTTGLRLENVRVNGKVVTALA